MACWAEPLASVMPAWACWFTSSMRTSLRFTRSWVFSTSVARVSTFWLTSPTSLATYFLVAQPAGGDGEHDDRQDDSSHCDLLVAAGERARPGVDYQDRGM